MQLLGAALYDPSTAVTNKATSALLAMTAFDTTNLRLAVTVPASGKIRIHMACIVTGATTVPTVLLGALIGATVIGRVTPRYTPLTANAATQNFLLEADFIATGVSTGAQNIDAAYAVQVIVASTNIKYGGPNNNSGANAWGAFVFEIWDPAPFTFTTAGKVDASVRDWMGDTIPARNTTGVPIVDTKYVTGTLQTAGDVYSKVSGLTFTGANKVDASVRDWVGDTIPARSVTGVPKVDVADWLGATAPANTGDAFARLGAPAGASHAADVAAVKSDTAAIKTKTDSLTFTVAGLADSNVVDWKGSAAPANTGDAFARLGAPAGASVSADVAAVKVDTAAVKVQTDKMVFTVTGYLDVNAYKWVGGTIPAVNVTGVPLVDLKYTLGTISPATAGSVRADAVTGAVGSVTGAVGSVTGLTASNLDAAVSSRMATYAQPTGFLAATFPATVASPTNITAGTITTVTNLTNAPTAGDLTATMKTSVTTAATAATPTAAAVTGAVGSVTGLTAADVGSIKSTLGVAGAGLTALGDTRLAHLDADISSRSTYAGGDTSGTTTLLTRLTSTRAGLMDNLDAAVSTRVATSAFTFSVAGYADVNIKYVNGHAVTGDGHSGTEFGPL